MIFNADRLKTVWFVYVHIYNILSLLFVMFFQRFFSLLLHFLYISHLFSYYQNIFYYFLVPCQLIARNCINIFTHVHHILYSFIGICLIELLNGRIWNIVCVYCLFVCLFVCIVCLSFRDYPTSFAWILFLFSKIYFFYFSRFRLLDLCWDYVLVVIEL